jgi:hypothetical protein
VETELETLGNLFASYVAPRVPAPAFAGKMFAIEICNVANQGQAYAEGESAYLNNPSGIVPYGWTDWAKKVWNKAKELYGKAKDGVVSAYDWTKDELVKFKGVVSDLGYWLLHSKCGITSLFAAGTCVACFAGGTALVVATEGITGPAVDTFCGGVCASGIGVQLELCISELKTEPQPNSLVSGPQMSELRQ